MSDAVGNRSSFGGNPGEPVPEVDPDDLKTFWQEWTRDLQAGHAISLEVIKALCKPGANVQAVCYRSSMIWVLNQFAQGLLAPWVKDKEVSDAVFRTMAATPMEWVEQVRPTVREGWAFDIDWPFDVGEFFRRLRGGHAEWLTS